MEESTNGPIYKLLQETTMLNNGTSCLNNCLHLSGCVTIETCRKYIRTYIFPTPMEWVFVVIYAALFLVGIVGNLLVCFVVWRSYHMQTVVNMFIFNLAVADFLVILFCLPPSVLADVTETWYMGNVMCKIIPFIQTTSVAVSVLTLSAISIERYFAICKPLKFRRTPKTIKKVIVFIWISGFCAAVPELIYTSLHRTFPEAVTGYLVYCRRSWDRGSDYNYQMFVLIVLYTMPISLMAFTYTVISRQLWRNDLPGTAETNRINTHKSMVVSSPETQILSRRRAAKMLMAIVLVFAICYLPIHVFNLLKFTPAFGLIGDSVVLVVALLSHFLCYINSAVNPIIYNFMSAKFRKEFHATLVCCRCCTIRDSPAAFSSTIRNRGSLPRNERFTLNTMTTPHASYMNQTNCSSLTRKT